MADWVKDFEKVTKTLMPHYDKNFVNRIFEPQKYGSIKNEDGSISSHRMRWDHLNIGGEEVPAMYPTIFWKDGEFIDLSGEDDLDAAKQYAIENNEYIPFKSEKEADWTERHYKMIWGHKPRS